MRSKSLAIIAILLACGACKNATEINKRTGMGAKRDANSKDALPAAEGNPDGDPAKATDTSANTDTESSDATSTNTATPTSALAGKASGEATTIANFVGKSNYGVYTEVSAGGQTTKSVSLMIAGYETHEDDLTKTVKSWSCTKCANADDPHCKKGSVAALYVSFIAPNGAGASGFPAKDSYSKASATDFASGVYITFSDGSANRQATGKVTFKTRPAAVNDPYVADVDFTLDDGKTYKATIESKVYKLPANPMPPKCADDEWLQPKYE